MASHLLLVFCAFVAAAAEPPELLVQTGHSGVVDSVAFSPDGRTLAGGVGVEVGLWDVNSRLGTKFTA